MEKLGAALISRGFSFEMRTDSPGNSAGWRVPQLARGPLLILLPILKPEGGVLYFGSRNVCQLTYVNFHKQKARLAGDTPYSLLGRLDDLDAIENHLSDLVRSEELKWNSIQALDKMGIKVT